MKLIVRTFRSPRIGIAAAFDLIRRQRERPIAVDDRVFNRSAVPNAKDRSGSLAGLGFVGIIMAASAPAECAKSGVGTLTLMLGMAGGATNPLASMCVSNGRLKTADASQGLRRLTVAGGMAGYAVVLQANDPAVASEAGDITGPDGNIALK